MGEATQLLATATLQEGVYFTRRPARLTPASTFRSLAVVGEIPKYVIPDPLDIVVIVHILKLGIRLEG